MKRILFPVLLTIISVSCNSNQNTKAEAVDSEVILQDENVQVSELVGSWIVETERRYFERDNQVVETLDLENIPEEDAYVYHFKSDSLVTVSNSKNEFSWDFNITKKDSVLTLTNVNGDAEDDELIYKFEDGKLVLLRKLEDEDPAGKPGVYQACFLFTLNKIN